MNIYELRAKIGQEIVDYNQLKAVLSGYAHPRGKISAWLSAGDLIRVKKGLYVFGPKVSQAPYSKLVLANLIYGPSALSLETALSFYGLIPEAVHQVTSITLKKNKTFNTPIGIFSYQYLSKSRYPIGIQVVSISDKVQCLMATPEKALCDYILLKTKSFGFKTIEAVEEFLLEDLRVDEQQLNQFKWDLMNAIVEGYHNLHLERFFQLFRTRFS